MRGRGASKCRGSLSRRRFATVANPLRKPLNRPVIGSKRKGAKGISREDKDPSFAPLRLLPFAFCPTSLSPALEKVLLQTDKRKAARGITGWILGRL